MSSSWAEVRRFVTLPSTNTYLLEEARRGVAAGVVVVADHQSAGRGRLGRHWEAPPGSCLLVSVLLRPVLPPAAFHLCTAAVAVAAADACRAAAGVAPRIKWPNDLVVDDRKLAGVLAESDFTAPGGRPGSVAVVVGIGINVDWPGPPGAGGTSLRNESDAVAGRGDLLAAFLDALEPRAAALETPEGRARLADDFRRRCATLGRRVRVDRPPAAGGRLVGDAADLTDEGHLVVETPDGARHRVAAGDVIHLRPVDQARAQARGQADGVG